MPSGFNFSCEGVWKCAVPYHETVIADGCFPFPSATALNLQSLHGCNVCNIERWRNTWLWLCNDGRSNPQLCCQKIHIKNISLIVYNVKSVSAVIKSCSFFSEPLGCRGKGMQSDYLIVQILNPFKTHMCSSAGKENGDRHVRCSNDQAEPRAKISR